MKERQRIQCDREETTRTEQRIRQVLYREKEALRAEQSARSTAQDDFNNKRKHFQDLQQRLNETTVVGISQLIYLFFFFIC